ncbi:MAG: hypothetical protein KFF73_01250 [Cyclobacteriaceae bacterium]|nr:hypothetical protein [Cyclobacteriaceae bacterium]
MDQWNKLKKGVKKVAGVMNKTANDIGDISGGTVETAGILFYDGLARIGNKTGGKPFFLWLGSIIKGISDIIGSAIKGLFNIAGGALGGSFKILGGIITIQPGIISEGFIDIISPFAGTLILAVGKTFAAFQSFFFLQAFERRLNEQEENRLKKVFKYSLWYYRIRIVEGRSGLFGLNSRAFALGNTIYIKNRNPSIDLLIHECTHVWQNQNLGVRYSSDALGAQLFVRDAYNWEREINVRRKKDWREFNMESQAKFLEDLWNEGRKAISSGRDINGNGAFFEVDWDTGTGSFARPGSIYTSIAREAILSVMKGSWLRRI